MKKNCGACHFVNGIFCQRPKGTNCNDFSFWTPKEETKVEEKLYTTGQIIDLILENKERTAESLDGLAAKWEKLDGRLIKSEGIYGFNITIADADRKWRIIEPKPKPVSFVEAFKAYRKGNTIVSFLNNIYDTRYVNHKRIDDCDIEEIEREWIISN